ncbi:MAG: HEAT repeat domain-containing protein [Acidobacteriota bacterium]|nr:HEAT repeat domain-containing protein [Acidobacteriota bacterium]
MLDSLEGFRRVLSIILASGLAAVAVAIAGLVIARLWRGWTARRRAALESRYQPTIDELFVPGGAAAAIETLARARQSHRDLIGGMLLRPLRVARGEVVAVIRAAAEALDRDRRWLVRLGDRRWWVRADSARALGLVRSPDALGGLTRALEDEHPEVRAAAVESLGLLGDIRAVPALLRGLAIESRQQRVRVVEALRLFGPAVTPRLVEHATAVPDDRRIVADVLGQIGGADALPMLIDWMSDPDAGVRAAAVEAAGTLGIDDRAHYFVLRALQDDAPDVRAMAARALARSPRAGTARYLEPRLDDTWDVAVQTAVALKRLGNEGVSVLERRAEGHDQAAQIAAQMIWERRGHAGPQAAEP